MRKTFRKLVSILQEIRSWHRLQEFYNTAFNSTLCTFFAEEGKKIHIEVDGTRYVYQDIDEKDKNHGINDTEGTNQGRMYEDKGSFNRQLQFS